MWYDACAIRLSGARFPTRRLHALDSSKACLYERECRHAAYVFLKMLMHIE
jgi:hypothetical protein